MRNYRPPPPQYNLPLQLNSLYPLAITLNIKTIFSIAGNTKTLLLYSLSAGLNCFRRSREKTLFNLPPQNEAIKDYFLLGFRSGIPTTRLYSRRKIKFLRLQ